MKIFTQITRILFTLLISVFIGSAALAQCVTPVFTSIGNSGPVCTGGTITLNAAGTVGGVSSGFIRMAGIGANYGHQAFNQVFSSGDRAGSIARISMAQFDAIFAGLPTDADRAAALKAQYDVLMFTWASPIDYNITWGLITAYLSTGGSVFVDGDYANVLRLNDGTPNSIVGAGGGITGGCGYTLVSPAPFPTLVANGVNGCFANDHLYVTSWPTWMKPYITAGSTTLAIAGIYPGGSGGRLIVQGPDQDFHASRTGAPGSIEQNQYQIILNQIDFLKANQSGITWTGPNGFTSNDANATITNVTAANAGVYTATLTNTTGGGCSVTATTTVVVTSSTPTITASGPTNFCPGGSVTLTASAGTSYNWSNGATTQSIVVSTPGNYTVTVNTTGCSGTSAPTAVIVQDLVSPVFTSTQANSIVALDAITGTAVLANYTSGATATDNCSVSGITQSPLAGTALANNVPTTVTLTATDPSGNKATQSFTVTATDQTPPVVSTQNITVFLDASGNATITAASVDNSSTDNVGITTYSLDKSAFNCSNVGPNTVNLTASDAAGNSSTATAVVTIKDNVPPIAKAQSITVQLDATGNATITPAQINNGSTDNCAIATYALNKTTFDCSNVGANNVILTVTDIYGNASTAPAVVTIQDNVSPIAKAQSITVQLDATGNATITPAQINNGSTDNCAIATYALNKTTFNCSNVGANKVILTVTDASGNAATATAVVTVQDNVSPMAIAQAITVQLDAAGNATITPAQINNGSTDNCAIATYALNKTTFNCSNVGANNVILTVTDIHGNASTAPAVVTIQDNVSPIAKAQSITVQLDATGNATITPAQINNGSTDNCAIATYALNKTTFNCSNVGANKVILTVTDASGNAATATAVVTVQDNVSPIAIAQAITVQLDAAGNATITPAQINNGSTDNCAIATYALNKTTFNCSNVGANTVTLTVTDIHGNTSTATAVVTVQDNVPPVVITQNITLYLSGGNGTITPAQINNGSNDACGIKSMTLNTTTFDCSTQGAQTVILTVTDNNGNVTSKPAVVTVIGKTPTPSIAVSRTDNTNTNLDAKTIALGYGAQNLTLTASNPNSAPGASTYLWSPSAGLSNANIANPVFTPSQAGTYTFNVVVTSEYGCQASVSVTITVIDARCEKGKVLVCHKTGSAKNPWVQICISTNAVATHLADGDILGTCATITLNEKVLAVTGSNLSNVSKGSNGTKEVVTILDQPQLSASNILSPNGDGQNDTWVITNLDKYSQNKVTIVDRNGKVVYTKVNYRNDWDGTFNTGILPEDTYYYIVDFGKGVNQLKGFISIVR